MAYFALVNDKNIVTNVTYVSYENEHRGIDFLTKDLGFEGNWIQTSYNTYGGVNIRGEAPLRYNFAGMGYSYDKNRDAFIPPKPFNSWLLNEDTCLWNPPTPYPTDGEIYTWNEDELSWVLVDLPS